MVCLSRSYPSKYFKACLLQNLLSPLFNTLSHIVCSSSMRKVCIKCTLRFEKRLKICCFQRVSMQEWGNAPQKFTFYIMCGNKFKQGGFLQFPFERYPCFLVNFEQTLNLPELEYIERDSFRTLSNIYGGAYLGKYLTFKSCCFYKKAPSQMLRL